MDSVDDELQDLDYTAYEHVMDFNDELAQRRMAQEEVEVSIGFHYEDEVPVLDVHATDGDKTYIDSYELEGVSPEAFEAHGYELWVGTFGQEFDIDGVLEEYDHGGFK